MPKPRILPGDPPWLVAAIHDYGVHEVDGPKSHPVIIDAYRAAGQPRPETLDDSKLAWCSAIECKWFLDSGLPGTKSLAGRSWLKRGPRIENDGPLPRGAIAVFKYDNDPNHGHVANVLKDHGDRIEVIGGNQSNEVNSMFWPRSKLIGAIWPHGWPRPGSTVPLPRPRPDVPQETEEPDPQIPAPQPADPDPVPAPSAPPSLLRRIGNWALTTFFGGSLAYAHWALFVLVALLIVGGVWYLHRLFGPDVIKAWLKRNFFRV